MRKNNLFKTNRFATIGVITKLNVKLQEKLWSMIDEIEDAGLELDYFQVFKLSKSDGNVQVIEHFQEEPSYQKRVAFEVDEEEIIKDDVFIIGSNDRNLKNYSMILMASEY
ncbi:MAG: hypothetical protein JXR88_08840 [Clostridia bacterium]|nr:hypothetical protein [Clostridia bacterium]